MQDMNSRDKWLLYFLLALILVGAAWLFGARPLRQRADALEISVSELQKEYDEKAAILAKKNEYIQKTEDYTNAFQTVLDHYPAGIAKENQIEFVVGLEKELGTGIVQLSYTEPEKVYDFVSPSKEGEPYALIESKMTMPVTCDYIMWKHLLDYVFTWQDKSTIPSISAEYDGASGKVESQITLQQYAVTGGGRTLSEPEVLVPVGTDNIFQSGTPLSYDGRTSAEKIQDIKKNYDLYIMLHGTASDVPAKVIAGQKDEGKTVSEKNESEELAVTVVQGEGKINIVYSLGGKEKRVVTEDKEEINIYVLSSERTGNTDESAVRVSIDNQTEKQVNVAVTGDDSRNPRFTAAEQKGRIEIIEE